MKLHAFLGLYSLPRGRQATTLPKLVKAKYSTFKSKAGVCLKVANPDSAWVPSTSRKNSMQFYLFSF